MEAIKSDGEMQVIQTEFILGLNQLQKDLEATDEEDPVLLIIAWKLRAGTVWEISKDEWINGFVHLGFAKELNH